MKRSAGNGLYVSSRLDTEALARVIGPERTAALKDAFAGERIEVPKPPTVAHRRAKERACELLRAGHSIRDVARRTMLSRRSVSRLKQRGE